MLQPFLAVFAASVASVKVDPGARAHGEFTVPMFSTVNVTNDPSYLPKTPQRWPKLLMFLSPKVTVLIMSLAWLFEQPNVT